MIRSHRLGTRMSRRTRAGWPAALAGLALIATSATSAAAAPLETFTFFDERSGTFQDSCGVPGGITVEWHRVEHGSVQLIPRGPDQLPHAHGAFQGSTTYTNAATGDGFTFAWRSIDMDLHLVDNGDGTSTAIIQVAGNRSIYVDGRRVAGGTGTHWDEVLVDNGGTPTDPSDDGFIEVVSTVKDTTGLSETMDFDVCAAMTGSA